MALQRYDAQSIFHRLGHLTAGVEQCEHLLALGALHSHSRPLLGDVGDGAVIALQSLAQVNEVLVGVGGVHHQQVVILLKHIEVGIVHGAAVFIGDDAVLGQAHIQCRHIAGQHMLQICLAVRTFDEQTAHVGHIEQAAHLTGVQMLGDNAAGVLDRHFPSAEVHQLRAGGYMDIIQLGTLEFTH